MRNVKHNQLFGDGRVWRPINETHIYFFLSLMYVCTCIYLGLNKTWIKTKLVQEGIAMVVMADVYSVLHEPGCVNVDART